MFLLVLDRLSVLSYAGDSFVVKSSTIPDNARKTFSHAFKRYFFSKNNTIVIEHQRTDIKSYLHISMQSEAVDLDLWQCRA